MKKRNSGTGRNPPTVDPKAETDPAAVPGTQVDTTSAAGSSMPELPNDRDEKVGMTGGEPSARIQQGARDLKRGVQDTSRATEADATYQIQKRS